MISILKGTYRIVFINYY